MPRWFRDRASIAHVLVLSFSACACAATENRRAQLAEDPGVAETPPKAPKMQGLRVDAIRCETAGKRVDQLDLNHDNRADLITITSPDGAGAALSCKQADLNFDGRLDAYFHYGVRGLEREQFDLDFDGRIDAGRTYDGDTLTLDEQDLNHDGFVDAWRRYEKGKLVRIENDRDADGRADMFTYFVGGLVDRIGYDVDGDGKVDQWDHDAARRARIAAEKQGRRTSKGEANDDKDEYVEAPTKDKDNKDKGKDTTGGASQDPPTKAKKTGRSARESTAKQPTSSPPSGAESSAKPAGSGSQAPTSSPAVQSPKRQPS